MKKFAISIATTLIASVVLVACNGSSSDNGTSTSTSLRATCTAAANWNALRTGMSLGDVQKYLGAPTQVTVTSSSTVYSYEACRGFITTIDETTGAISGTDTGGTVTWSGSLGVSSIVAPKRVEDAIYCELNYYDHPRVFSTGNCRTSSNPF